ncbi:hypothetical protein K435DRAFT_819800 [Dendrothele bispora CBS 962.96]|uniref:FAD/NAD(P)-binding domain-containing protein n=1 Tax=Dendrothele bispora (strain CBS 962.96) TaxID=1314807 RepID=A0A4S8M0Z9_DENBC|nr:hypothetical protein K435DRAFT_819800 [Dendrothele bispora CBS 962.96]
MISGSNADFFESSSSQRGSTTSPLTHGNVGESSKTYSKVVTIGSQPTIYLAQPNLDSVLFEGFMGNGFTAGVENFHGFPTRILGPELMDKFCEQPLRFGTHIITETISKSVYPTVCSNTGAKVRRTRSPKWLARSLSLPVLARKRLGLKDEEPCWQSGTRTKPPAVTGGCDSATEKATYPAKYSSHLYVIVCHNELCTRKMIAKRLILKLCAYIYISFLPFPVNGLFYAPGINQVTNPQWRSFRTQLQTNPDGHIVTVPGTTQTSVRGVFTGGDGQDKRYRQAITSAGSGCMAVLQVERLIAESEEKEMMGRREREGRGD